MTATTWNPADLSSVTLGSNNLLATATAQGGVRAVSGQTSGKFYFELTLDRTSSNAAFGVGNASAALATVGPTPANACVVYLSGTIWLNGASTGKTIAFSGGANGYTIGVAVDVTSNLIWFKPCVLGNDAPANWNGTAGADPATGTGGISIASIAGTLYPLFAGGTSGDRCNANFSAAPFMGSVPSGFTAGWPTGTTLTTTYTTWSAADLSGVTLLASNLAATTNVSANAAVRSPHGQVSAKYYFEGTVVSNPASSAIGVANGGAALGSLYTTPTNAAVVYTSGAIYVNNVYTGVSLAARVNGDVISIAVDVGAALIWFRVAPSGNWNNSGTANPATGAGGLSIASIASPAFSIKPVYAGNVTYATMSSNFGDSAFVGAVPSGFTAGWATSAPAATNAVVTQASVEHFVAPNPQAQVTQVSVEHFVAPSPYVQATQVALEEWAAASPAAQITQVALEEWATTASGATQAWVTQIALGEWVPAGVAPVPGAGEVDAAATVTGAGVTVTVAAGAGEVDAAATVTATGAVTLPGAGSVDAAATVTAPNAVITAVTGTGEVDAGADVRGAGFQVAVGTGEVDASADVRGMGALLTPPNSLPFVPGIGWSIHRRPTFDTIVAPHPSGSEVRMALWQNCLWEFELAYDALASNDAYPGVWTDTLQTIMGFYLARGGQSGTFLYIDPGFNAMTGQGIGAGDGVTVAFPFVRAFGGQIEPVSWVTTVAAIYLDGAPVTSGWLVNGATITFDAPPADGVVVSADFSYGFICRFLEDSLDFEQFMDNLWQLKSLKFRQVRL